MKRKFALFALLAMVLLMAGCTINQNLTPSARYYEALKFFNDNVAEYKLALAAADPATQAKWKAEINPIIRMASDALDVWKTARGTSTAEEKETLWLDVKRRLLAALIQYNVITVKK